MFDILRLIFFLQKRTFSFIGRRVCVATYVSRSIVAALEIMSVSALGSLVLTGTEATAMLIFTICGDVIEVITIKALHLYVVSSKAADVAHVEFLYGEQFYSVSGFNPNDARARFFVTGRVEVHHLKLVNARIMNHHNLQVMNQVLADRRKW